MFRVICLFFAAGLPATNTYAASEVMGTSIQLCYDQYDRYMGGAILSCVFEYSDSYYVVDKSVSTYYKAELSDTQCLFSDIRSGSASSGTYAYGE